jgi:TRAP-type C4-dicarboxylate transport system permease small subunit
VHKIFLALGIVFIVFAGVVAVLSYELDNLEYTSQVPANFIRLSIVTSMMPYIVLAVVSFVVAFLTANAIKRADEKIIENQIETKPKQETDLEKTAQKEIETA